MIKDRRGFTLTELLAALVIICLLSAVAIFLFKGTYATTMTQYDEINDSQIFSAARSYAIENNSFKGNNYACVTVKELVDAGYLKAINDGGRIVKMTRDEETKVIDQVLFVNEC